MRSLYAITFSFGLLITAQAGAQNIPAYVPSSGLAAWYPFTGNAIDSSNNGNSATVYGPTLTTDRFGQSGKAYRFNGSSDYLLTTTSMNSTLNIRNGSYSISLWFKADWQRNPQDMQFMYRGDAQIGTDPYCTYLSNGTLVFRRDVNSGTTINSVSYSISGNDTNIFHHLLGTYDSSDSKMTIYLDGSLVSLATKPGTVNYNTSAFVNYIGAMEGGQNFKGVLDDIGVWTRALDRCEVSRLFYASSALITGQPKMDSVIAGQSAQFRITDASNSAIYQWQADTGSGFYNLVNAGPYTGVSSKMLSISPTTIAMDNYRYQCIRTGGGCTEISASAKLRVQANTGIFNIGNRPDFVLYPNPNMGFFTLKASGVKAGTEVVLSVMDMAGRLVHHQQGTFMANEMTMDLQTLSQGTYLLKLTCGDERKTLRFTKTD